MVGNCIILLSQARAQHTSDHARNMKTMLLLHQTVAMLCSSAWLKGRPGISNLDTYSLLTSLLILYGCMDGWMYAK